VIAGDDHAPVLGKAGQDGERGRAVETVIGVDVGHVLVGLGIGRHFHIAVDPDQLPDRHLHVGQVLVRFAGGFLYCGGH
jgi:hypothetical protein